MVLIDERKVLINQVEILMRNRFDSSKMLTDLKVQVDMMMTLLKDLMNQAQIANNTFAFVNEYFDIVVLARRC